MKEREHRNYEQDKLDLQLQNLPEERQQEEPNDKKISRRESVGKTKDDRKKKNRKERARAKQKKKTDKELARVTYLFVTLFLVMIGYLVYFNVVKSKDIINSPYNVRQDLLAKRVVRGKILDQQGNVLARTIVNEDGSETREYPYGEIFSHVVGYSEKGKAGIELKQNFSMLTSNAFFLEKIANEMKEQKNIGDNIVTTLNTELQEAAYNALGNNKGAAIVMEASTGKILAMVSKPGFNPNYISENWDALNNDPDSSLYNRATMGQYAPGSTFKIVTALEYMRENPDFDNFAFDCQGEITEDGTTIHCFDNTYHGPENLSDAFANSCNSAFSSIGLTLNNSKWKETTKDLLFNSKLPSPLPYKSSSFQLEKRAEAGKVMMTAIGQGDTLVSPYHMALITSAIANGGILMKPYVVDQIANYTGTTVKKYMPEKYGELMTAQEAAKLTEYMTAVVDHGTGTSLSGEGYTVAGKTGTAEVSIDKKLVHSWFVGFSNIENPDIVVSVVIENADTDRITGTSVAKQIFNEYYY